MRKLGIVVALLAVMVAAPVGGAEKGLPFPLLSIGGAGGVAFNPVAYPVNPSEDGWMGLPAVGAGFALLPSGERELTYVQLAQTFFGRLELSYSYMNVQLGSFAKTVQDATGGALHLGGPNHVALHTVGVKGLLIEEGSFDCKWMPAVALGVQFKENDGVPEIADNIQDQLGGFNAAKAVGYSDDFGVDVYAQATKMIRDVLPRPLLVSLGFRMSRGILGGFAGFAHRYHTTMETSFGYLLTDQLLLFCEYKQIPRQLHHQPGVLEKEDDWISLGACYVVNEHMTVSGGWIPMGHVVDKREDGAFTLNVKWEF